jgi:phosphoglycolate phosphatase-like HAD superfamily hydrolase
MQCSKCGEKVKPVVAVDIDGTLADYHGHFLRFMSSYTGDPTGIFKASLEMYSGDEPFSDYCCHIFDCNLTTYRQVKLAYRQGGMKRSMPIAHDTQHLMKKLNDWDVELWVTTTRPYLSLDTIVPDTLEWLERHGIAYDYMLFDEDKYQVLADRVDHDRVIVILDDLPEMYDAAAEHFSPEVPILVRGQFNKGVERPNVLLLRNCADEIYHRLSRWDKRDA